MCSLFTFVIYNYITINNKKQSKETQSHLSEYLSSIILYAIFSSTLTVRIHTMSSHYGKEYKTLNPKTDAHLDTTLEKRNTRCRLRGSTREFTHSHRQLEQERRELRKKFDETIGETMCLHSHLIENVYSSLCSKYPRGGVEEWRDKFFGAQTDHYVPGKMVTKKWVERFLAPHLGVSAP